MARIRLAIRQRIDAATRVHGARVVESDKSQVIQIKSVDFIAVVIRVPSAPDDQPIPF